MEERIEIEKDILRRMQPIIDRVGRHTVPIFSPSPDGHQPPLPLGSGILVHHQGRYCLLTAGHCLMQDGKLTGAGIFYGREFVVFPGPIFLERHDMLRGDVGLVLLDAPTTNRLKESFVFLDETRILFPDGHSGASGYLIGGYPNAKVYVDWKRKGYQADLLPYFCDRGPSNLYAILGFDPATHLILEYDEKNSTVMGSGQPSRTVHPIGMSGGGIWYIWPPLTGDIAQDQFFLVGLLIEYHSKQKVIVGSQINLVERILARLPSIK